MALTFVASVFGAATAPAPSLLRGSAAAAAPPARDGAASLAAASLATLLASGAGAVAAGKRSRRSAGTVTRTKGEVQRALTIKGVGNIILAVGPL